MRRSQQKTKNISWGDFIKKRVIIAAIIFVAISLIIFYSPLKPYNEVINLVLIIVFIIYIYSRYLKFKEGGNEIKEKGLEKYIGYIFAAIMFAGILIVQSSDYPYFSEGLGLMIKIILGIITLIAIFVLIAIAIATRDRF